MTICSGHGKASMTSQRFPRTPHSKVRFLSFWVHFPLQRCEHLGLRQSLAFGDATHANSSTAVHSANSQGGGRSCRTACDTKSARVVSAQQLGSILLKMGLSLRLQDPKQSNPDPGNPSLLCAWTLPVRLPIRPGRRHG